MGIDAVLARIEKDRGTALENLIALCRIPAMGPESGGDGEAKKGAFVERLLKDLHLTVERFDAPDGRVPGGKRPNLVARVGKGPRVWFLCHLDVVPPGERAAWRTEPFEPKLVGDRLYGRGTEDNGQALVSTLSAYRALIAQKMKPARPIGFAFVADEESGSEFGVEHLLKQRVFHKGDSFLVPDWGIPDGTEIEIAEKGLLWLRFTIHGKQGHASLPQHAINAHRAGAYLVTLLDANLPQRFPAADPLFRPRTSTFEPTKREANVPNINTIPGEDIVYFDCRVLPSYRTKDVLAAVRELIDQMERAFRVKVDMEVVSSAASPPTRADAPVVKALGTALEEVRSVRPKLVGIGGGTLAGVLRAEGFDAAVWSTTDEMGHSADEYARPDHLIADAKVFAAVMASRP
jgi:succinyl-diaminopimelate desuccinylase